MIFRHIDGSARRLTERPDAELQAAVAGQRIANGFKEVRGVEATLNALDAINSAAKTASKASPPSTKSASPYGKIASGPVCFQTRRLLR